jgi:hypothetical protein
LPYLKQYKEDMAFSSTRPRAANQPVATDVSLISELYEAIAVSPPAIEERKLLVHLLINCAWFEAAREVVSGLLAIVPTDRDAQDLLTVIAEAQATVEATTSYPPPKTPQKTSRQPTQDLKQKAPVKVTQAKKMTDAHSELETGYKSLFGRARMLQWEMTFLQKILQQRPKTDQASEQFLLNFGKNHAAVEALVGGNNSPAQVVHSKPASARKVASQMERSPTRAVDIAFQDLMDTAGWLRSIANKSSAGTPATDDDSVREALQKRTQALISALPLELQQSASTALMHIEHEILNRTYVVDETMLGDPVSEIPRENFLVTEDGYPWDMEELAQAITSNGGVMRNPLSKQLFTPNDVKAIVRHPLGKSLAALQLSQQELSKGVRPKTIDQLAKLSATMLSDDSSDQMESRHVMDEFLAYVATLPEEEQNALDKLRVPAKDSHTGQAFDSSIGEAVRDAQGNRVCIHKIGDFLGQAARHLRQNG